MKIAMLMASMNIMGGGERLCLGQARKLMDLGHDVTIFTKMFDPKKMYATKGIDIKLIGKENKMPFLGRALNQLDLARANPSFLKYFDVVIADTPLSQIVAAKANKEYEVKAIWYCNHIFKSLYGMKPPEFWRDLWLKVYGEELRRADQEAVKYLKTYCNSEHTAKTQFEAVYHKKADGVIYCAVDTEKFKPGEFGNYIFSINRFEKAKDQERLVLAADYINRTEPAFFKDTKIIIAGSLWDKKYFDYVKSLITEKGLTGKVELKTNLPDKDVVELYRNCKFFVYTPYNEDFGLGPIEAMSCGKAAIGANYGGVLETIGKIDKSLLFEPKDEKSLAEKIMMLNKKDLKKDVLKYRNYVMKNFSWDVHMKQLVDAIKK
jgi:glycosyltransferase involved in cell wall biosynthesis